MSVIGMPGFVMSDQGKPVDWRARSATFVETASASTVADVEAKLEAFPQL